MNISWFLRVLCSVVISAAAVRAVLADPVAFTFKWPDRPEAKVSYQGDFTRSRDGVEQPVRVRAEYMLSGSNGVSGLRLDHVRTSFSMDTGSLPPAEAKVQQTLMSALAEVPSFSVGADGLFRRCEDLEAYSRGIREAIEQAASGVPEEDGRRLRDVASGLIKPAAMEEALRANWGQEVSFWNGLSCEPGVSYEVVQTNTIAFFGNSRVPVTMRYRVTEFVPAAPARPAMAKIELSSSADRDALRTAVEKYLAEAAAPGRDAPILRDVVFKNSSTLITCPDDLRPAVSETEDTAEVKLEVGGRVHTTRQVERHTTRYEWR